MGELDDGKLSYHPGNDALMLMREFLIHDI